MSNPLIKKPHVYKKGKILNLKPLDEGTNKPAKQYVFSSNSYTIRHITESCNNLNQIVGRNFLGISKLLSFFGLSRDPSESHSKDPSVFDHAKSHFQQGGRWSDKKSLEEIKNLLLGQHEEIERLKVVVERLKRPDDEKPINRQEVSDFNNRLKEIQDKLTQVIG